MSSREERSGKSSRPCGRWRDGLSQVNHSVGEQVGMGPVEREFIDLISRLHR